MSEDHSLARSARLDNRGRIFGLSDLNLATSSAVEGLPDEQKSSPIRRTLLLIIFFELLLTFILWIIYMNLHPSFEAAIQSEVKQFRFNSSLFDMQVLGCAKFIILEVTYGAFLVNSRWASILTTTFTSAYIVAKCTKYHNDQPAMCGLAYTILICTLLIDWISTIFLDNRVLPQERMAKQLFKNFERYNSSFLGHMNDVESCLYPSIRQWATNVAMSHYTRSVYASPEGSLINGDDSGFLRSSNLPSYGATDSPLDIATLLEQAQKLKSNTWTVYENDAWQPLINQNNTAAAQLSTANITHFHQKLFRLEGFIAVPVNVLFNDIVFGVEFSPHWNRTILYAKYIQKIPGENLDIVHTATSCVLGGLIKSRDFVILRAWGESAGVRYIASSSVCHPKCPPTSDAIRAEQLINAILLQQHGTRCRFTWITAVDLKGWLRPSVIETGIMTSMVEFFSLLTERAATLCGNSRLKNTSNASQTC